MAPVVFPVSRPVFRLPDAHGVCMSRQGFEAIMRAAPVSSASF
jgi:hypothetical protein